MKITAPQQDYALASAGLKEIFTAALLFGWIDAPQWVGYVFLVAACSCFLSIAMLHSADYLRGGREE